MGLLMELLGHRVLHTQKENLQRFKDQLSNHHKAHEDEKKAHERAMAVQTHLTRLHAAVKLHAFHRQLSGKMQDLKVQSDRKAAQSLIQKIGRVESGQQHLHAAMAKKSNAHQDVEKHLLQLRSDVDDALKELDKLKRK